jgi:hypothetical protein
MVTLFQGVTVRAAELFFGDCVQIGITDQSYPLRLVISCGDGSLRLFDMSDLMRPMLKYCTSGLTFYAHGAQIDSKTGASPENISILKRYGAVQAGEQKGGSESESLETKSNSSHTLASSPSSSIHGDSHVSKTERPSDTPSVDGPKPGAGVDNSTMLTS